MGDNRLLKLAFAVFLCATIFRLIAPWLSVTRAAWWIGEAAVPIIGTLLIIGSTARWNRSRIIAAAVVIVAMASFRYVSNGYVDDVSGRKSVMTGH